jgi:hypothetical protein
MNVGSRDDYRTFISGKQVSNYYKKMPCSFANKINLFMTKGNWKRTECFQANAIVNVPRSLFWKSNNFMPHCYAFKSPVPWTMTRLRLAIVHGTCI